MDASLFTNVHLDIVTPARAYASQVFYDEPLCFQLDLHIARLDWDLDQVDRVCRSDALKFVAEIGYLDPNAHHQQPQQQQQHPQTSTSHARQVLSRSTSQPAVISSTSPAPLPIRAESPLSGPGPREQYANMPMGQPLWSANWNPAAMNGNALEITRTPTDWKASFKWPPADIIAPKIASHLLAIDVTFAFQHSLDAGPPPTPSSFVDSPLRLSSSSGPPAQQATTSTAAPDDGDLGVPVPVSAPPPPVPVNTADEGADDDQEQRMQRAKERRKRMLEDDYAFQGFDQVNILQDLSLDDQPHSSIFVPASRLPTTLASAAVSVGTTPSMQGLKHSQSGHARSLSRSHGPNGLPLDTPPVMRRIQRKVFAASSAVNVRMRTLPIALASQQGNSSDGPGLTLSVEVLSSPDSGLGFEVQSVAIELDQARTTPLDSRKREKQPLFDPPFPIALDRVGQYNFLFSLSSTDVILERADENSLGVDNQDASAPVPIAAALSPKETLSRRYQHDMAQTPTNLDFGSAQIPPYRPRPAVHKPRNRKSVCIVVRGRPIDKANGGGGSEAEPFESRWNCALDVSSLAPTPPARESQQSVWDGRQRVGPSTPQMKGEHRFSSVSVTETPPRPAASLAESRSRPVSIPQTGSDFSSIPFTSQRPPSTAYSGARQLFAPSSSPATPRVSIPETPGPATAVPSEAPTGVQSPSTLRLEPIPIHNSPQAMTAEGGVLVNLSLLPIAPSSGDKTMTGVPETMELPADPLLAKRTPISLFDIFFLEVFVMNKAQSPHMFTVSVPSQKAPDGLLEALSQNRSPSQASVQEAGLVALQDNVLLGPLQPGTCMTSRIRYLALKPGIQHIGDIALSKDADTGETTLLKSNISLVVDS